MARRSVCVTANVRKSQETRSQTRPLSTFPYVQNAPSVVQARLRGVRARRRLLRRASAGHDKKINKNKLNRDLVCHFQEPPKPPTRHFRAVLSLPARANQEAGFAPTPRYGRGSDLEVILEVIGSADRLPSLIIVFLGCQLA